ncbi:hypothetical protein [Flaviflexus huanghaiensis]|uniref:hypothetical protein n=1 Tax=Flaviflexus huanghaiensis TaxID=1111473 RepID=UPI0015F9AD92|nr:hypothetical protein [Flaviflexus huanghaiensis]
MTKQPVVGTIIIGILVTIQGLWALALAFNVRLVRDVDPTTVLVATLLGLAVLLIVIALWPRSAKKQTPVETLRFSPLSAEEARVGVTTKQNVVADLRWIDSADALTVPVVSQRATILADPALLAIRTSSPDVNIDPDMGMRRAGMAGTQTLYLGPGLSDPSEAHLTVDAAAKSVTVRAR